MTLEELVGYVKRLQLKGRTPCLRTEIVASAPSVSATP